MKRAELHSNEETAEADELVEDDKPVVARKTMNRLRQIVIAHGSYVPGVVNNSSNIAMSCSPNGFGGWTFRGSHWCTGSPYTTSTVSSLNLAGSPPLPESHTVFLSGFHHETTLRQIRTMVEEISCHYELIDRNIHFVDGSTIVISNEVDAKRLTDALNGYVFHGASIVASYGQRPYEFGTYPYPQTHPYLGFQGRGQDWQQESGQFWHQY
ncbi:hypothetical protein F4680DRAFT_427222 [Xylaria scruposa]|nr:hypothetical protein F4680DRAFT_427222 [Xylaria scruposa]